MLKERSRSSTSSRNFLSCPPLSSARTPTLAVFCSTGRRKEPSSGGEWMVIYVTVAEIWTYLVPFCCLNCPLRIVLPYIVLNGYETWSLALMGDFFPSSLLPHLEACSRFLEHRAEFPQFLNQRQSVGFLGRVISSLQGLYLYTNTKTHTHTQTLNIHALSGIRTHDPGFRASEDSALLRPLGYRDRQWENIVWKYLRTGCWGEYLHRRGMKW
jgi:hypothetical protein